jgi:hypothetical protein
MDQGYRMQRSMGDDGLSASTTGVCDMTGGARGRSSG